MLREWNAQVDSFWRDYLVHAGHGALARPVVFSFDDTPATQDQLAALVLAGTKRATAGPVFDDSGAPEPPPKPGDLSVVVDGAGQPCCVIRTTEVRVGPLDSVDAAFAWDEGEGDRTRAYWLRVHRDYVGRHANRAGVPMHDGIEVVFERFIVVWPLAAAD